MVEGFDPLTSQSVQARHSYLFSGDTLVFNQNFAESTSRDKFGRCCVDLDLFSQLVPDTPGSEDQLLMGAPRNSRPRVASELAPSYHQSTELSHGPLHVPGNNTML